ncbi:MAG: amino acid permease [Patescibacteria group bacterium]
METGEVKLARTLGLGSIILLGIGALLGGGIFTLLGPAAGLAGPGLFLSMLLGAGVAFLNLQMYIALGTTFPEAGGGYLWIKKGLGNFQGFMAGWLSWFAHSAAAGLYALSFGFYAFELIKMVFHDDLGWSLVPVEKIAGVLVVLFLGYVNWKGAKTSGRTGNIIAGSLLAILVLFILFGVFKFTLEPVQSLSNFEPLLPAGILGILAAASLFYIAFEGSEIQVQTGEETRDPKRTLRVGLLSSWAIVSAIYFLVSLIIIAATRDGGPIWQVIAGWGEGAIARAAQSFMPFGYLIMIIGGLFANFAALNATIYSSSRVSFALARDKNIWSRLAAIHFENLTPHLSVIASTILIVAMVIFLPLLDVASMASLLFILLFLQLNIAGINIHYKWPDTQWGYKVPFFPLTPILAILIYILLALTLLQVNLTAWVITAFWMLLGLINYFAYAQKQSREKFETGIVYEEAIRIGPKTGKRILLPIAPHLSLEEIKHLAETAFVLTSKYDGELVIVTIHEIPPSLPLSQSMVNAARLQTEKEIFAQLHQWVEEYNKKTGPTVKDINFHSLILIGRDLVDVILDVVKIEDCDLLMINWTGATDGQNVILSRKIDRILRESKCDLLVIKDPKPFASAIIAVNPEGISPYAGLVGEISIALKNYYQTKLELLMLTDKYVPSYLKPDPSNVLKSLNMKRLDFDSIELKTSPSITRGILKEAEEKQANLVIIGSARPRLLEQIRLGSIAEYLAKNIKTSLMILRGHQGATEAFWIRILKKLNPVK